MTVDQVAIREMLPKDFLLAARIMSDAFGEKMPLMKKFTRDQLTDFMLAGGIFDEKYLKGHYVADFEGQLLGVMHLDTWEDKKKKPIPPKRLGYMFRNFGLLRVLISGISLFFLDTNLSKDEMYLDFIAIEGNYRGLGLGTCMLNYGEDLAEETQGINRFTLSVVDDNIGARRLYEAYGFKVCEMHKSKLVQLFTGIKVSYKLEKLI